MNRFLSSLPTWLYWYPLRFLTRVLPRQTVVVLGFVTGFFSFWLRPGKRRIVQREISNSDTKALSPAALKKLTRNSFQQSCAVMMETFCFPRIYAGNIDRWMRAHGIDNLNHALTRGKGVVIVLAHYGANQMVMAALGYRGYTINQIGSRPDDWHRLSGRKPTRFETRIFDLRMALERSLPATFIYIDKSMRPVYTALHNNQIMILAADGRAGTRFFTVPSGKRHINVSAGPFRIAASTGAALIPAFPVRDNDGIHDLYIESPIQPENTDSMDSWAENAARLYAGRLNEWIQLKPDHYAMLMAEAFVRSDRDPVPLFEDYRNAAETGS
jgi:phosphatidylinositol dimannoside acyltransferase